MTDTDVETESFTVYTERFKPADPRLGRHVRHDSRSLSYLVEAAPVDTLQSVRHPRHIPILDQGNLGSCTGNAAVGCLGTGEFYNTVINMNVLSQDAIHDEQLAVSIYSEATHTDPYAGAYPPTDTGSDGLTVAKVLLSHKMISGYQHAVTYEAALTALSKDPILFGTKWLGGMFTPDPDGRLHLTGSVAGGHEIVLDELDMGQKRVWLANSWTVRFGVQGRAYLTFEDFDKLRADQGDVTVLVPLTAPAPQPTPPAPTPPTPAPPAPTPVDPKVEFTKAYELFKVAADKYLRS